MGTTNPRTSYFVHAKCKRKEKEREGEAEAGNACKHRPKSKSTRQPIARESRLTEIIQQGTACNRATRCMLHVSLH